MDEPSVADCKTLGCGKCCGGHKKAE
jgi:hypothetical protein